MNQKKIQPYLIEFNRIRPIAESNFANSKVSFTKEESDKYNNDLQKYEIMVHKHMKHRITPNWDHMYVLVYSMLKFLNKFEETPF